MTLHGSSTNPWHDVLAPETREQRRWFDKVANVPAALPRSANPSTKKALAEDWDAEDRPRALDVMKRFEVAYGAKLPKAVAKITKGSSNAPGGNRHGPAAHRGCAVTLVRAGAKFDNGHLVARPDEVAA
jgi:hypothetical protein